MSSFQSSFISTFSGYLRILANTLLLFTLYSLSSTALAQMYVDANATGANDGSSWTNAYTDLQDALTAADGEDEIWIAEGTYKPVVPDDPNNVLNGERQEAFTITGHQDGLKIYGGFDGSETQLSQRNPKEHVVLLSGDIDENDEPFAPQTDNDNDQYTATQTDHINGENSYHVILFDAGDGGDTDGTDKIGTNVDPNITNAALLDGIQVTGGLADGAGPDGDGGAIYCDGRGAGNECSPTLKNIIFYGNYAGRGAGIYNNGDEDGTSSPNISNSVFLANSTASAGTAIYNLGQSGGNSSPLVQNNIFTKNSGDVGFAIANDAQYSGNSKPTIVNSTFANNGSIDGKGTGVIYSANSNPTITNSIFFGNGDGIFNDNSTPTISHSLVEGSGGSGSWDTALGTDGGGNIDTNPQFVDANNPEGDDDIFGTVDDGLTLQYGSPAIDAGDDTAPNLQTTDITGADREQGNTVDMGVYETEPNTPPTATNVTISGDLQINQQLTGSYDYNDADGDTESGSTYQWYRADDDQGTNKTPIADADEQTYTLTVDDLDKYISFEVTPNDGKEAGTEIESNLLGPVHPFAGGSGTEADPYQIATAAQLDSVRHHLDKHFLQTADINLDVAPYNQNDGWVPIGRLNGSFVGSYDGGGHSIEGLFTTDLYQRIGLFYTLKGDIHDLKMTNVDIAVANGGALAYEVIDASLSNIEVSGKVSGSNFAGGLMGSYTSTSADSISDIKATITVESQFGGAGGIAGTVSGNVTISNIVSSQEVAGRFAGGLAGVVNNFTGSITNSYVAGVMAGDYFAGGFIGYKQNGPLIIENSYSTADVTGQRNSGGITGLIDNTNADEPISINQSYVTGSLDGNTTGGLIGEINGTSSTIDLSNSFWDTDSLGQIPSAGAGTVTGTDGKGLPITKMKRPDTYTDAGWDLDTVWEIKDPYAGSISYPRLRANPETPFPGLRDESVPIASKLTVDEEPEYKATLRAEYSFTDGDDDPDRSTIQWYRSDDAGGTNKQAIAGADSLVYTLTKDDIHKYFSVEVIPSDGYAEDDKMTFMVGEAQSPFDGGRGSVKDPYQIAAAEQLYYVRDFLDNHFTQTADIDLDVAPYNQGDGWEPIAQANGDEFSGNFDGNGYTVSNLTIDRPTTDRVGLFGTNKGTLINIELVNVDIVGQSSAGALVGNNWPDATIESSSSSGIISAENTAGGLVGINQGTLQNSNSSAFVEGRGSIGGLAGINGYGTGVISNASATGDITGANATANSLGGLVGSNRGSEIRYSYATGSVTGNSGIGGFVGSNRDDGALIEYSYASGEVTASGDEASISSIGGFVGSNRFDGQIDQAYTFSKVTGDTKSGFTGNNEATITNSFWNTMLSDQQNSDGGTGKTTFEMKTQSTFIDSNWDFDSVWQMKDPQEGSISYPHLQNNTQDPAPGYRDESAPVAEDVAITGTPDPGSALEVTYTYTDADGDAETGTKIQWYRSNDKTDKNKTPIAGATSETYTITDEDVCKFISVEVTPGDGYISGETVTASVGQGNAPFAGGCGTVKNPFQIATADQLDNVRDYLGSHFIQTADIDLDMAPYNQSDGWEPILGECIRKDDVTGDCMEYEYFSGSYNGNNYTIQNLFIDRPDGYPVGPDAIGVGLFARTDGATIENLSITESDITGRSDTGILSGYIQGGEFSKISVSGTLKGHQRVAGVSGAIAQSKVSQVYANVDVTNTENYAGGITGNASESIIQNSYATGTVTSSNKNYVGGFIGSYNSFGNLQDNQIKNNYAAVQVNSSGDMVGGFSGHLNETNGDLDASGNFWDTDSSAQTSSAFGQGRSLFNMKTKSTFANTGWDFDAVWQIDEPQNGSISYPYLRNNPQDPPPGYRIENLPVAEDVEVTGEPEYKATLEASYTYNDADDDPENGTIVQWYRSDDENGTNKEAIHGGGSLTYHLTKADVHKYISFEVTPDDGIARGETVSIMVGEAQSPFDGGRGTEANPYQIATAEQLDYVRDFLDVHFIQTDDIDLDAAPYNQGAGWDPIGGTFTGVYNGDTHTISNLFIDSNDDGLGLFNTVGDFNTSGDILVKNLTLESLNINSTGKNVGGMSGKLYAGIQNVVLSGKVTAANSVGGVTGSMYSGQIVQTQSSIDVNRTGTSTDLEATAGGLVGLANLELPFRIDNSLTITIEESYSTGAINSSATAGGIIGTLIPGPMFLADLRAGRTNLHPTLNIRKSYFSGIVEATDRAGGIIGIDLYSLDPTNDFDSYDIRDSYVTGTITSDQNAGGIFGKGKAQDQNLENIYVAAQITGATAGAVYSDLTGSLAVSNVYWDSEATTLSNAAGTGTISGATDLSRFEMRTPDAFTGWDFDSVWQIEEVKNGYISYPYLVSNEADSIPGQIKVDPPTLSDSYHQQYLSATKAVYETEITDDGNYPPVSERGFNWSLTEDFSADTVMVPHTDDGLGVYADTLKNLPPYTTIYLRSYAKNPVGTTFGDIISFTTEKQPLNIIGHFSAADKVYDGNTIAEFDKKSLRLDSVFVDHDVRIDSLTLEFTDKNIGSDIETTITSAELSGDDTEKYLLSLDSVATSKADITPRPITVTALPQSVEYGNPVSILGLGITSGSLVEGETLSGSLARTGNTDVGDFTITKGTLSASSNYDLTYVSAPFTISPKILTITADSTLEKNYGENDPELTYEASGFAYFENESILTGSLSREKGEAAGNYAIKLGDLSAGDNYNIDFTGADFTINGKELLITVDDDLTKVYGEEDPALTYRVSGFKDKDDRDILSGSLSREEGEQAGNYAITQGNLSINSNYSITLKSDSLTIEPATLEVSASEEQTKVYGDPDPELTYRFDGFVSDDDSTLFEGTLLREKGEDVGAYQINKGSLSAGPNYDINFSGSSYQIAPEILSVVADSSLWKFEGDQDPQLSYEASGFKRNDDEGILTGSLSREEGETPGSYDITSGNLSAGENYEIDFISADFKISRTPPQITQEFPAADTSHVAVDTDIEIIFDKEITLVDEGLISLVDENNETIPLSASVHSDTLRLSLSSSLEYHKKYTMTIGKETVENVDEIPNPKHEWSFTTIIAVPEVVATKSPEDQAKLIPLLPEFEWNNADRASGYTIQVATDSSFDVGSRVIEQQELASTSFQTEKPLQRNNSYYWRVRAENIGGEGPWSDTRSFTTIPYVPEKVVLASPQNNQTSIKPDVRLEWEQANHATSYNIQLATDQGFTEPVLEISNITDTKKAVNNELNNNTTYFWRVQGSNSGGTGEWSEVWNFTTQPSAPTLSFPSQDEENISIAPRLSWVSNNEESRFRLRLSSNQNFETLVADTLVDNESVNISGLETETIYYWQVRVETEQATSPWTSTRSFTTRSPPNEEDQVEEEITFGGSSDGSDGSGDSDSNGENWDSFDYRLVGLPGNNTLPVNELFNGEYGRDWKVYKDNGNEEDFLVEHSDDNPLAFTAGQGYWVLSKKPVSIEETIPSVSISKNDTYSITLNPGWNIISNPFKRAADWNQIQTFNGLNTTLFDYEGSFSEAKKMIPFSAYYVYNDRDNKFELEIPYTSLDKRGSVRNKSQGKISISKEIALTIENEERNIQSAIHIVYPDNDSLRQKAYRYYPPMKLSKFGVSFLKEKNEGRTKFYHKVGDVYQQDRKHYQVVVKSNKRQHIHWKAHIKGLDESAGVLVVDPKEGRMQILQQDEAYSYMAEVGQKTFDIYVGSLNELDEIRDNLIPAEFTLKQNYPNPFNPTTTIRFGLQKKGDVQLEVFDILGRKVQTLIDEKRSAGWHNITFDAQNLASGTYFYRLIIGQKVQTHKMVLIK